MNLLQKQITEENYLTDEESKVEEMWLRVATFLSSKEKHTEYWRKQFYSALENYKMVLGGRIMSNAGAVHKGTSMINCFVLGPKLSNKGVDSIEEIYNSLLEQALTLKTEGGWGYNFSHIRPRGAFIKGVGIQSPGVVRFMELFDKSSEIITSGSNSSDKVFRGQKKKARRGAMMAILSCFHPSILEFIGAKQISNRLTKFNLSVAITDDFMKALSNEEDWQLMFPDTEDPDYNKLWDGDIATWKALGKTPIVYDTIPAKELWDRITKATYNHNEPGVFFIDNANRFNNLRYCEKIVATNPCVVGETLVAVADGRSAVSIKKLAEEGKDVPVFTILEDGSVGIKNMKHPRLTAESEPILKITLDDGSAVKVTKNHKIRLKSGVYIEAKDLKAGDSLEIMTKFQENYPGKRVYHMYIVKNGVKGKFSEHRMIAEYYQGKIPKNYVVHHADYNSLNNAPSNLLIMSRSDHNKHHLEKSAGKNNCHYSGINHQGFRDRALALTKKLGRRFSTKEWKYFTGLSACFSKYRTNVLGTAKELSIWAAEHCGFSTASDPRVERTRLKLQKQGYEVSIIDGVAYVNLVCEHCGNSFMIEHNRREQCFCSNKCVSSSKRLNEARQLHRPKENALVKSNRASQIESFNTLKLNLKRTPLRKEWEKYCSDNKLPFRLGRTFKQYSDLKESSMYYNHKVASVEPAGNAPVYNGTVENTHNYFIGNFEGTDRYGNRKFCFINNLNCGEQPLPKMGTCLLGSINLVKYIKNGDWDYDELKRLIPVQVRMMDNVVDLTYLPLKEQTEKLKNTRRIGMGIMGYGSALYMLGLRYGSPEALASTEKLMAFIAEEAYKASANLAEEKGTFPDYTKQYWESNYINQALSPETIEYCKKRGMRNSHLLSIAPNGSTSIYAGTVSGGIEPVFAKEYTRTVSVVNAPKGLDTPRYWEGEYKENAFFKWVNEGEDSLLKTIKPFEGYTYKIDKNRGLTKEFVVKDYGWERIKDESVAVTTADLTADEHINTMKVFAKYVDSAISKTVNIPNEYSYESFQHIYYEAWKAGIKGLTTYRAGTMASVLSSSDPHEDDECIIRDDVKLPDNFEAKGVILRAEGKKWYLIVGFKPNTDGPFATFVLTNHPEPSVTTLDTLDVLESLAREKGIEEHHIQSNKAKSGQQRNATKIGRAVSLLLRHGVAIKNIVAALDKVQLTPNTFVFQIKKYLASFVKDGTTAEGVCPNCNSKKLIFTQGCKECTECGTSLCG